MPSTVPGFKLRSPGKSSAAAISSSVEPATIIGRSRRTGFAADKTERCHRHADPVLDVQFLHDDRHVVLIRLFRELQLPSDLLVGPTFKYKPHDRSEESRVGEE